MRKNILFLIAILIPAHSWAADAPAKKWNDQAEFSLVTTNGNSKAATTSAKNAFGWDFLPDFHLDTEAGGLGSKSKSDVTAEQYFAWEKVAYKLDGRNYLFEKYRWDRDRFAKMAHRHELSVGFGRELWKTPKDLLIAEGGPTYVNEQRIDAKRNDFMAARAYSKLTHKFSDTAAFSQDAEYIMSLKTAKDNRLNTETAVTASLTSIFSLKASYIWKHNSLPASGAAKDDTTTAIALLARF
jgi:putative salt-induced outer membrane protein YdiY